MTREIDDLPAVQASRIWVRHEGDRVRLVLGEGAPDGVDRWHAAFVATVPNAAAWGVTLLRIGSPGVLHQAQALIDGLGAEGAAGLASVVGQLLAPAPNRAPRRVKRKVPA